MWKYNPNNVKKCPKMQDKNYFSTLFQDAWLLSTLILQQVLALVIFVAKLFQDWSTITHKKWSKFPSSKIYVHFRIFFKVDESLQKNNSFMFILLSTLRTNWFEGLTLLQSRRLRNRASFLAFTRHSFQRDGKEASFAWKITYIAPTRLIVLD